MNKLIKAIKTQAPYSWFEDNGDLRKDCQMEEIPEVIELHAALSANPEPVQEPRLKNYSEFRRKSGA